MLVVGRGASAGRVVLPDRCSHRSLAGCEAARVGGELLAAGDRADQRTVPSSREIGPVVLGGGHAQTGSVAMVASSRKAPPPATAPARRSPPGGGRPGGRWRSRGWRWARRPGRRGVVGQHAGDRHPLLLPARELL